MFPVVRVDQQQAVRTEQLGTKSKFWFRDGQRRMLFKAEERGTGEDWAEKVACHLCELLGIPRVRYELAALFDGGSYLYPGVVCESCVPPSHSLVLGNQLLLGRDPAYPADEGRKYKVREHTVHAVENVVERLAPPSSNWMENVPAGIDSAFDVFIGYVMLDAWIANQDRHHENWAAISDDQMRLAPTFDHGASMARNLSDDERQERLTTRDQKRRVAHFVSRARSGFFATEAETRPMLTVDAFRAFAQFATTSAERWLNRLGEVGREDIERILHEVPNNRMSRISKEFTLELLVANQQRLLMEPEET